jgi:uncharacterized phosphosugar-binding protein
MVDTVSYYDMFFDGIQNIVDQVSETQGDKLEAVAEKCSDAIAAGRWVHTFGAGHSSIPGMETFPRIGSFVGFHQLNELNLSFNGQVVGGMAQRQSSFLERVEGYAEIILANHRFSPQDVAVLFSNSGINELIVDMALLLKEKGVTVVGLTSIAHSMSNQPRHSSGKRLSEVVDISIDTCCPEGDALVDVPGLDYRVAGSSTIVSCIIMNGIVAQTAGFLRQRGYNPTIWPSHNVHTSPEEYALMEAQEEKVYKEYWERLARS